MFKVHKLKCFSLRLHLVSEADDGETVELVDGKVRQLIDESAVIWLSGVFITTESGSPLNTEGAEIEAAVAVIVEIDDDADDVRSVSVAVDSVSRTEDGDEQLIGTACDDDDTG